MGLEGEIPQNPVSVRFSSSAAGAAGIGLIEALMPRKLLIP